MTLRQRLRAGWTRTTGAVTITAGRVVVAGLLAVAAALFFGIWAYVAVWIGGSLVMVNPLLGLTVFVVLAVLPAVTAGLLFRGAIAGGGDG